MRLVIFLILVTYPNFLFPKSVQLNNQVEFSDYDKNNKSTHANVILKNSIIIMNYF